MTLSDATLSYFKGHKLLEVFKSWDLPILLVFHKHLHLEWNQITCLNFIMGDRPLCEFLAYFGGNTDYLETVHSIRNIKSQTFV